MPPPARRSLHTKRRSNRRAEPTEPRATPPRRRTQRPTGRYTNKELTLLFEPTNEVQNRRGRTCALIWLQRARGGRPPPPPPSPFQPVTPSRDIAPSPRASRAACRTLYGGFLARTTIEDRRALVVVRCARTRERASNDYICRRRRSESLSSAAPAVRVRHVRVVRRVSHLARRDVSAVMPHIARRDVSAAMPHLARRDMSAAPLARDFAARARWSDRAAWSKIFGPSAERAASCGVFFLKRSAP